MVNVSSLLRDDFEESRRRSSPQEIVQFLTCCASSLATTAHPFLRHHDTPLPLFTTQNLPLATGHVIVAYGVSQASPSKQEQVRYAGASLLKRKKRVLLAAAAGAGAGAAAFAAGGAVLPTTDPSPSSWSVVKTSCLSLAQKAGMCVYTHEVGSSNRKGTGRRPLRSK